MFAKSCSLLLLCFIASVCCEYTLPGPCPNISVPTDFSWKKLQGSWYVIKETKDENNFPCPVDTYTVRDDKTVSYLYGYHLEGYTRGIGGPGMIDESQPNKLTIKYTPDGKPFERYVLASDYENYAVIVGCVEKGSEHQIHVKIATRSQDPPVEAKLAAYLAIQNLGVPTTSLVNHYDKYEYCNGYP